jgi:hypothetical protein
MKHGTPYRVCCIFGPIYCGKAVEAVKTLALGCGRDYLNGGENYIARNWNSSKKKNLKMAICVHLPMG